MRQNYLLYPPPWEEASSYLFQRVTSREETKILFYKQIENTFPRTITVILEQTRKKEKTKSQYFGNHLTYEHVWVSYSALVGYK